VSELVARFEVCFPRGATIRADLRGPATGFSVTAFFGPSGCGKTTILRSLAGLEHPHQGHIRFADEVWLDAGQGIHCTPQERNVGFLFQDYALFPHLTVAQNIEYGLARLPRAERRRQVGDLLERFQLVGLERRYPQQVSGGQQQRVALARTLARKPGLLLLDEPLSSLDTVLREQVRLQLRTLLTDFNIPILLVTHDRHEAIALADHLVVMDEGRTLQSGPVQEVFARPANEQVARMVGVDTVEPGRIVGRANGTVSVQIGRTRLSALVSGKMSDDVFVCIRAEEVEIASKSLALDVFPNQLPATISKLAPLGSTIRLDLDCGFPLVALLPRRATEACGLEVGKAVTIHVPAAAVHLISATEQTGPGSCSQGG
jgi:molybdate transport system ATP-binding protein